jgi:hypothetical protein
MRYVTASEIKTARLIVATGNTYPHRTELAAMGGRWSAVEKGWVINTPSGQQRQALASKSFALAKDGVEFRCE